MIRSDDILIDVGANFGWYTTLFSKLVEKKGQVHSFEPVPWIFNELQKNVRLNTAHGDIFANQYALGNRLQKIEMFVFSGLPCGHASMSKLGRDDHACYKCPMTTLDNYIFEKGIKNVHIIKCDVEGAEMFVLKGAESPQFGYQPCDLLRYLQSKNGYVFYRITKRYLKMLSSVHDYKNGDNVVCAISDLHGKRIGHLIK
jgi:FkbM family methyltransferase